MTRKFEIWSDNIVEADWFQSLDRRLEGAGLKSIGRRGANAVVVDELVVYDRPDIILLEDGMPILVVEKTREVPTGHNVGQRFARLARAAELGVPTIFFLPFDAKKHGIHGSICSLNARLIRAMLKMSVIHDTPVLPVNWPVDGHGELFVDGRENREIARLVSEVLDGQSSLDSDVVSREVASLRDELRRRELAYPPYGRLPPSADLRQTDGFFRELGFQDLAGVGDLKSRAESLVYRLDMSPAKCRRQDPYTGMQFVYDYGWLRTGPNPANRAANLILHVPRVDAQTWITSNPEDYESKSCNWYLIADAIVLQDAVIHITEWPLSVG
ncbi:MAG: hypothetical protein K9G08_03420 [Pontimonas sp.]|nr:hypothetical protein [Pontimonas sp.]